MWSGRVREANADTSAVTSRRAAVWVLTALLAACGGRSHPRSASGSSRWPELDFRQVGEVGGASAEGPSALGAVDAGALIPGRDLFALVDGTTEKISYFTLRGEHVRTFGGEGRGPGEFEALRSIRGQTDGGLCAWDIALSRTTEFDSVGAVVRTAHPDVHTLNDFPPSLVGFADDCSFVLRDERSEMSLHDEPEGMRRDTVRFLLFTPGGSLADTLLSCEDAERWLYKGDGWARVDPIFGNDLFGFMNGSELWVGMSDSLRWERISIGSGVVDTVRVSVGQRVASQDEIEAERQVRLNAVRVPTLPGGSLRARGRAGSEAVSLAHVVSTVFPKQEREGILAAPSNPAVPAYDQAVPGGDGSLWLREFPMPGDTRARWLLLSSGQQIEGQISMTRNAEIIAGDQQRLLVLLRDTLDVQVVRVLVRQR